MGFVREAGIINNFGESVLVGNVVDAFQKMQHKAVTVLPS
jgi:hypothetical protein